MFSVRAHTRLIAGKEHLTMAPRTRLQHLPFDIQVEILRRVDQRGRISCMTVCKALHRAATHPSLWRSVDFRTDAFRTDTALKSAARFVRNTGCVTVKVKGQRPDDVTDVLLRMAGAPLMHLHVTLDTVQRIPAGIVVAPTRLSGLRTLTIVTQKVCNFSTLSFPSRCLNLLETLVVRERCHDRNLDLEFPNEGFVALQHVHLNLFGSNIMHQASRLPCLRKLVYRNEAHTGGDTYEDALLAGACLDHLEFDLGEDSDIWFLSRELNRCAVRRLVIHASCEQVDLMNLEMEHLEELEVHVYDAFSTVALDSRNFRSTLRSLSVRVHHVTTSDSDHVLSFHGVSDPVACMKFMVSRLHVPSGSVQVAMHPG